MEEVEEIQTEKENNKKENVSNFAITLLFVVLAVAIGFAILLCIK